MAIILSSGCIVPRRHDCLKCSIALMLFFQHDTCSDVVIKNLPLESWILHFDRIVTDFRLAKMGRREFHSSVKTIRAWVADPETLHGNQIDFADPHLPAFCPPDF